MSLFLFCSPCSSSLPQILHRFSFPPFFLFPFSVLLLYFFFFSLSLMFLSWPCSSCSSSSPKIIHPCKLLRFTPPPFLPLPVRLHFPVLFLPLSKSFYPSILRHAPFLLPFFFFHFTSYVCRVSSYISFFSLSYVRFLLPLPESFIRPPSSISFPFLPLQFVFLSLFFFFLHSRASSPPRTLIHFFPRASPSSSLLLHLQGHKSDKGRPAVTLLPQWTQKTLPRRHLWGLDANFFPRRVKNFLLSGR